MVMSGHQEWACLDHKRLSTVPETLVHLSSRNPFLPDIHSLAEFGVYRTRVVPLVTEMGIKSTEVSATSSLQAVSDNPTMKLQNQRDQSKPPWKLYSLHL